MHIAYLFLQNFPVMCLHTLVKYASCIRHERVKSIYHSLKNNISNSEQRILNYRIFSEAKTHMLVWMNSSRQNSQDVKRFIRTRKLLQVEVKLARLVGTSDDVKHHGNSGQPNGDGVPEVRGHRSRSGERPSQHAGASRRLWFTVKTRWGAAGPLVF